MTPQKALVFAPLPPPPGGIASIAALLMREFSENDDVRFCQPVGKGASGRFGIARSVENVIRLACQIRYIERNGTVVLFSSAGLSFWEKCVYSVLVRLVGRRVAIVMVDGNFPRFFEALPLVIRKVTRWVVRGDGFRLAAQSPAWSAYYRSIFPAARITEVTASVDREFFLAANVSRSMSAAFRLLFVGWIIEEKGIGDLLEAVTLLATRANRTFQLRLVGPLFDRDQHWEHEARRRGISHLTTFAGRVDARDAMLREYRDADAFILPSHAEGFPVALLEALASGLACIGTRVGGIPDILDHGNAGLLVDPHSPIELASAILRVVNDDELRIGLGIAGAAHARQRYTPDACAHSYASLLGVA